MIIVLTILAILILIALSVVALHFILENIFFFLKRTLVANFFRPFSEQGFDDPIKNGFRTEEEEFSSFPQQYSLFFDFIFPCILFFITFWPIFINFSFSVKLFLLGINYLLLLVPFIIFWSKLRNWETIKIIHTFSNPMALKYIITGIVYPSFYILLLGFLRYFSMGREYIPSFQFFSLTNVLCIFVVFPHILLFLFFIGKIYQNLRLFFVKEFKLCFHSLHVYFLRSKQYWRFCHNIHKYYFACNHLFGVYSHLNQAWKQKYPLIMKTSGYIWSTNPKITLLLIPIFFVVEFLLQGKIHYWFYFLFTFFCLKILLVIFRKLTNDTDDIYFDRGFQGDCNLSNYYNEKSWFTPYYPRSFAFHITFDLYGKYISPEKMERIKQIVKDTPVLPFTRYYKKTGKDLSTALLASKLPIFRQIKLYYRDMHGKKWIHTSSYKPKVFFTVISKRFVHTGSSTPKVYHPILPYLLQDIFSKISMVAEAHNWRALYPKIQQAERLYPSPLPSRPLYGPEVPKDIAQYEPKSTMIVSLTEYNTLTAFSSWVDKGVEVSPHKDSNIYANAVSQSNPDVSLRVSDISYKNQSLLLGLDLKASSLKKMGTGSNYIVGLSQDEYTAILDSFLDKHGTKLSKEAKLFIKNLGEIHDVEERLFLYRENVHHFLHLGKFPPINIDKMIFERYFSSEYKAISFEHKVKMGLLSDYVWEQEPLKGNSLRKQTLNLLNDPNVMAIKKDISEIIP